MRTLFFALALSACSTSQLGVQGNDADVGDRAIVGGDIATEGQFPHQVALQNGFGDTFCGGSVILDEWVLTAAHCIDGSDFSVEVGMIELGSGTSFEVDQVFVHPDYTMHANGGLTNDVALVRIAGGGLETVASPITLASGEMPEGDDWVVTVSGYGANELGGVVSNHLRFAQTLFVPNEVCAVAYGNLIDDTVICAGDGDGGNGACQGDSGGAALVETQEGFLQVGIVSYAASCAEANVPTVFASVPNALEWIDSIVREVEDDHGDWIDASTPIDEVAEGTLHAGDSDVFSFTIDTAADVRIESASNLDLIGVLVNDEGEFVGVDDDHQGETGGDFDTTLHLPAGTYHLMVEAKINTDIGDYLVSVTSTERLVAPVANYEVRTDIDVHDRYLIPGFPDSFTIEVTETSNIEIWTTGDYDLVSLLATDEGTLLHESDDDGFGLNPYHDLVLEPGVYIVQIEARQPVTGLYQVSTLATAVQ